MLASRGAAKIGAIHRCFIVVRRHLTTDRSLGSGADDG